MRSKKRSKHLKRTLLWAALGAALLALAVAAYFIANDRLLRSIYREDHLTYVSEAAEEYGLDIYFVAAVAYAESEFDPEAVSGRGAVGLMQIMPETGEWIAGHMGIQNYSAETLKDPKTNLRMGCWYLSYLSERYDGKTTVMLCAYNAGPTTVDGWLDDPSYTSDGETLTSIPFDETRQYVDKVISADEQYEKLYASYGALGDQARS